jgi:hypothetical protein
MARKSTGGYAPRKQIVIRADRMAADAAKVGADATEESSIDGPKVYSKVDSQ